MVDVAAEVAGGAEVVVLVESTSIGDQLLVVGVAGAVDAGVVDVVAGVAGVVEP